MTLELKNIVPILIILFLFVYGFLFITIYRKTYDDPLSLKTFDVNVYNSLSQSQESSISNIQSLKRKSEEEFCKTYEEKMIGAKKISDIFDIKANKIS